jgi:MFS-type transporter involved in bile tolerance (Atg22 family)
MKRSWITLRTALIMFGVFLVSFAGSLVSGLFDFPISITQIFMMGVVLSLVVCIYILFQLMIELFKG